ncbi:MAG: hypothetical protein A2X08_14560 [Bacteroidetes bacterium GWA2_32_17]|nr:MAG: hypothetical protein A2X08_14560 [Bacteroidetes bacterium GWA2_32_17]
MLVEGARQSILVTYFVTGSALCAHVAKIMLCFYKARYAGKTCLLTVNVWVTNPHEPGANWNTN